MKKLLIIITCLLLLASCKKEETKQTNETKQSGEVINVKSDDGNWTTINETFIDSLNNKELIGEYAMSIPDWKVDRSENSVVFKNDKSLVVILYKNGYYSNKNISGYSKINNKQDNIGSFNVNYEDGKVNYNNSSSNYVSYYINENDITIKLVGITSENRIKELDEMIKAMIESLEKENFVE
jgi:PBP1b-binding outer membrane lipoprotein LpoB